MSSYIRIVAVPLGEAPEWVRKKWVGVEIPLGEQPSGGVEVGVRGGKAQNTGGYRVETSKAMEVLGKRAPQAAQWWEQNVPLEAVSHLVFAKHVCQVVTR